MKKIVKSLPALGLALAASMAFAFNMPSSTQDLYGLDPEHGWININEMPPGASYSCDNSGDCLYDGVNGTPVTSGTFRYIPPTLK
ncbi:hypothetical protein KIH41_17010 [Litoribacter ruber]|uniref:hypothetical protein n=1 Tax=Litoribacter ruber TaxID=702568 RepID=UPI001BDA0201|nr:hypothetical protein [Litoribacter ruber]MBT0812990.1 hypothetical protein [Litoribacter ruber]